MGVTFIKVGKDGNIHTKTTKSEFNVKVYPLICDGLTLTCDLPEDIHAQAIKNFKQEGTKPAAGYLYSGIIKDLEMKPSPYLNFDEGEGKITSASIQCKPFTPGTSFLRLNFNPSKVDLGQLKFFIEENWLTKKGYGFDYLINKGKITRIDFAVDISCEEADRLYYHYPKIQVVKVLSKSGRTEYLGGKVKNGKQIVIYDRIPAIKAQNEKKYYDPKQQIPEPEHPVMRVEIRLSPKIPLKDLALLKNPFEALTVAALKEQENNDLLWKLFLALARFEGAQTTLKRLPKYQHKLYSDRLKKGTVGWWKPEHIWDQLPAVLHPILTA